MNLSDFEDSNRENKELVNFKIEGLDEEVWRRLSGQLFDIIEEISKQITGSDNDPKLVKDIAQLSLSWAKAKLEKPSLENEKLKAEITQKYAETKKTLAETGKLNEEILEKKIQNLENIIRLFQAVKGATTLFINEQNEAQMIAGVDIKEFEIKKDDS